MARLFATPAAFKASLEARLKNVAAQRGTNINSLRLKLVIERLLARLFALPNPPWILKGGYAMELRYRPRARATRDIDLTCDGDNATPLAARLAAARDQMQEAAEADLNDFLSFQIGSPKTELAGAPAGGARFPYDLDSAYEILSRFWADVMK